MHTNHLAQGLNGTWQVHLSYVTNTFTMKIQKMQRIKSTPGKKATNNSSLKGITSNFLALFPLAIVKTKPFKCLSSQNVIQRTALHLEITRNEAAQAPPKTSEMQSAVSQALQMVHMHINFLEALGILHLYQRIFPNQKKLL